MSEELRAGTPESQNSTCSSYVTAPESPQVSHEMHSPGYTMPVNPMSSDRRLYGYGQHQYHPNGYGQYQWTPGLNPITYHGQPYSHPHSGVHVQPSAGNYLPAEHRCQGCPPPPGTSFPPTPVTREAGYVQLPAAVGTTEQQDRNTRQSQSRDISRGHLGGPFMIWVGRSRSQW